MRARALSPNESLKSFLEKHHRKRALDALGAVLMYACYSQCHQSTMPWCTLHQRVQPRHRCTHFCLWGRGMPYLLFEPTASRSGCVAFTKQRYEPTRSRLPCVVGGETTEPMDVTESCRAGVNRAFSCCLTHNGVAKM